MAKRKKRASTSTIKRGTCRVVKGKVRICATKTGRLYISTTPTRKRRKKAGTKKRYGKKLKKPKSCVKAPKVYKKRCRCKTKTGKTKMMKMAYCRAPKRKVRRKKR